MSDYKIPDLPSDEELGIAGESLENDQDQEPEPQPSGKAPPPGTKGPPPAGPAPPRRRWLGPATLLVLVAATWLTSSYRALPSPAPVNVPDSVFSSGRAMIDVVEIARRAHPPGSPQHARVREHLLGRLRALGLEPEVQTDLSIISRDDRARAATVRNIVARIPGTGSTGALVLTAHYDGRGLARAAGDDGTGVATVLEVARALLAGPTPRNDVIILLTDAEELGLLGARAFVERHAWMDDVAAVLSVEMRGGGGPSIMFETGDDNGWIVQALAAVDPAPVANSMSYEVYRRLPNDTDFTPFREVGVQGLNFAAIGRAHVYHQAYDDPEHLSEATLQHHGIRVLAAARELANRDLVEVDGPDRVYFSVPLAGIVTYGSVWVIPVGLGLLVLAGGVVVLGRRGALTPGGMVVGVVLGLLAVALPALGGWGLVRWLRGYHPEAGALHGSLFHHEGAYVAALAALSLVVTSGLLALARRRFAPVGLALGGLVLPLVAALGLTFAAPLAAMNLQWPVAAALLAAALVARSPREGRPRLATWLVLAVLSVPVWVFMVPMLELVWLALSVEQAAILGGLFGLTTLLLLPFLGGLREPNGWWMPVTGLVAAGLATGVGMWQARPGADDPAPSTLVYLLDRDTGEARWATRPGRGAAWARDRTGASLDVEASLEDWGLPASTPYLAGPAPMAAVAAPVARRVSAEAGAVGSDLVLELERPSGAEGMWLRVPEGSDARLSTLNGRRLGQDEGSRGVTLLEHWGEPDGPLRVGVDLPAGATPPGLDLIEHHLRPGELLEPAVWQRPPDLAPDITSGSDRALLRSVLELGALPTDSAAPGVAPADSAVARPDTTAAPPDTTTAPADSGGSPEGRPLSPRGDARCP